MNHRPPAVPFTPPTWPSFTDRPFGAPLDLEYDGNRDLERSIEEAYRIIRARAAAGGCPWSPKTAGG